MVNTKKSFWVKCAYLGCASILLVRFTGVGAEESPPENKIPIPAESAAEEAWEDTDINPAELIPPVPTSGVAPQDDPIVIALRVARASAEAQIAAGELVEAGATLGGSLRTLPPDRGDLADAAQENVLLVMFLMNYLMPGPVFDAFVNGQLEIETYPTDKLLLCLHNIFIGGREAGAETDVTREISYLTGSEHRAVRAMALFNTSDPYFHHDPRFTRQHIEILVAEYPELDLAQVAQNLVLPKEKDAVGLDGLGEASEILPTEQSVEPWAESLRERVEQSAQSLTSQSTDETAIEPLLDGALNASDWRERHFSILMVESEGDGPQREALVAAVRELALREGDTPEILEARILMSQLGGEEVGSKKAGKTAQEGDFYWANLLLETPVGRIAPDGTPWEDRVKGIQSAADRLRANGLLDEAETLLSALAAQYPNSLVSADCGQALAEINAARP